MVVSQNMYFQLGALCLLGSLSVSSALPPCFCTRNLKPVCGSDGQTYNNVCLLRCAQVANAQLFMERDGRCDGTSLGPPRDVRQAEVGCICTLEYMPLCGTDGKTYPNRCSLRCARRSALIDVAYSGECRNKRETGQSACSCSQDNAPVCGTDGTTYKNACYLNCSKETILNLDKLYDGGCDNSVKIIDSQCVGCTLQVRPICGTDGNTYRNPCMLNCARENDEDLHIDYDRPCDSRLTIADPLTCAGCTRMVKPVCGTNGKTYRNPCWLNCERDKDDTLHIDYEGPCGSRPKV